MKLRLLVLALTTVSGMASASHFESAIAKGLHPSPLPPRSVNINTTSASEDKGITSCTSVFTTAPSRSHATIVAELGTSHSRSSSLELLPSPELLISETPPPEDSLQILDSLRVIKERIERLQNILDKVTFGSQSYFFTRLRSWVIPLADPFNDTLAHYFFEVLENDSTFIESFGDIQVVATPEPSTHLISMFFSGNNKEKKGQQLREILEKKEERNMYERVLASREYSEDRELVDRNFKVIDPTVPAIIKDADTIIVNFERYGADDIDHDSTTVVTVRLFDNISFRVTNDWGIEAKLGNEELGYPMWTSGNLSILLLYDRIKLGALSPFKWGLENDLPSSVRTLLQHRRLNGAYGVTGEFEFGFAGGAFSFGAARSDADGTFADTTRVYSLRASGQGWYSFALSLNNNESLLRFKVGFGLYTIGVDSLVRETRTVGGVPTRVATEIDRIETRVFWSPYFKVDFINQQFQKRFGGSFQYFRDWVLASVWLELVRNRMRVEVKFATPLLRTRELWEPPYFVTLSIPITFPL